MALTVRAASVAGAVTASRALTHAEMDANWAHVIDSANHAFTPSGSGAVARTVSDKLQDIKCVFDFMTAAQIADVRARTGLVNVKAAVTAAFAAHKHLLFPDGVYYVGDVSTSENIFGSIDGDGGPVTIATEGLPKFKCNTTASVIPIFFNITNAVGVQIGDVEFEDTGSDLAITWRGAAGVKITVTDGVPSKNIKINSIYATGLVNPFVVQGTFTTRATGIKIGLMWLDGCYYGPNLQNNGDGCKIDLVYANGCVRSSFVFGVEGYEANIFSNAPLAASGDCMIQAQSTGYDTTDLKIKYTTRNTLNSAALVACQAFGEGSRRIENLDLSLDVDSSSGADVLAFRAYNAAGTVENTSTTNNVFDGIRVKGRISSTGDHARIYCQPSTKGSIVIGDGLTQAKINSTIWTYFNYDRGFVPILSFTPVLKGGTSAGTGTYTLQKGRYWLNPNVPDIVEGFVNLAWSAHTGTGNMFIDGLPFTASSDIDVCPCTVLPSDINIGAGNVLHAGIVASDTRINLYDVDQGGAATAIAAIDTVGAVYIWFKYRKA